MVLNIAHRGFSGSYPENTMLAFQKALELGVDAIEIDVQ
ncbi:MAG: glycerophosphodiester phosphodiesterase, partial [Anaerolineaceae bacterium]|nr:glycerophosphodiester phosphodiesterase [Anaerolineaceae bacterium]